MTNIIVSRWVRGFNKLGDALGVEYQLSESWTVERLRELCNAPKEDPMFDSYALTPAQARVLVHSIDEAAGEQFDFFLEADSEDR